jgi:hypothetical protein
VTDQTRRTRKIGRYRAEVVLRLCVAIGLGATYRLACMYAGISESTFYSWRKQTPGRLRFPDQMTPELVNLRGKTAGLKFDEIIGFFEGEAVVKWLAKIEKEASEGSWQAAAWKLERRHPEDYGRRVIDQRITGGDGGAVEAEVTQVREPRLDLLSADELEFLLSIWGRLFGDDVHVVAVLPDAGTTSNGGHPSKNGASEEPITAHRQRQASTAGSGGDR